MKFTIGPLNAKDVLVLYNFLQLLRGVKIKKGEELNVPHQVLDIVTPAELGSVLPICSGVLPGKFYAIRAFSVHGVTTGEPYIGDRLVHVELAYEDGKELCGDKKAISMPHSIPGAAQDGRKHGEYLNDYSKDCNYANTSKSAIGSSPSPKDTQVGGTHYSKMKIQPIDFITANELGYMEGNIIKYVCRYKSKNGVEDLKKAQHYLQMLIEQEEHAK